jgi:hypothetical protein
MTRITWYRDWVETCKWYDAIEWCQQHNLTIAYQIYKNKLWIDFTNIEDCVLFKLSCQDLLPWN